MKNGSILFLAVISLLVTRCKEPDPKVISGRLMKRCGEPWANREIFFKSFVQYNAQSGTAITDENGYFSYVHTQRGSGGFEMRVAGIPLIHSIPANCDLGEVYYSEFMNYRLILQVNNPYTANDTLSYRTKYLGTLEHLAGPFSSGIVDTVMFAPFEIQGGRKYSAQGLSGQIVRYNIQGQGVQLFSNYTYIHSNHCDSSLIQDLVFVID